MAFDYGRYFGEIAVIRDLTTMPEEARGRLAPPPPRPEPHRIVLYLGCNVFRTSHMVRTVTAIFDRLGLDYLAVGGPTYCCGIVHHLQGHTAAAGGLASHTVRLLERYQPEEVVMWCPSCIYFYDEVQQTPLPFAVRHASEFLVSRLPELALTHPVNRSVALHHHTVSEPRRREGMAGLTLLGAVPGIRLVENDPDPRLGRACTPAVHAEVGMEAWNRMVRDEIDRVRAAGADTLATMYHGCQRYICPFEAERPVAIEHYLTLFGRGLGIDFEDKFKKYRLWQDPERVLAETTPCQRANHVDPARARRVVGEAFGRF